MPFNNVIHPGKNFAAEMMISQLSDHEHFEDVKYL